MGTVDHAIACKRSPLAIAADRERDIVLAAKGQRTVRVTDRRLNETRTETAQRFEALLTPTQRR